MKKKQKIEKENLPIKIGRPILLPKFSKKDLEMTCSLIRQGLSDQVIETTITHVGKISREVAEKTVLQAKQIIKEEYSKDREFSVSLHIERYNKEIQRLFNIDVSDYNKYKAIEVKNYAFFNLLDVLTQKEKILGLHSKLVQIKINNTNTVKVTEKKKSFDLSLLTLEEKIDFYSLIQKVRRTEEEMISLVKRNRINEVPVTEDIPHEEVIEKTNISQIEQRLPKIELIKEPDTILSLKEKLMETLAKKAEEASKKSKNK